jgi:hypothetical protein
MIGFVADNDSQGACYGKPFLEMRIFECKFDAIFVPTNGSLVKFESDGGRSRWGDLAQSR